jgi:hypothetical protein
MSSLLRREKICTQPTKVGLDWFWFIWEVIVVSKLLRMLLLTGFLISTACVPESDTPGSAPSPSVAPTLSPATTPNLTGPNEYPNPDLSIDFELVLGASQRDRGIDLIQTSDGGYAVLGYTSSFGQGGEDLYLVRLDEQGQELWSQTYGGQSLDNGWSVFETESGDLMLFGFTGSSGAGGLDYYLVRTDPEGEVLWESTYGGVEDEYGWDLSPTADGGFVLAGQTESYGSGDIDGYLIKVDGDGRQQWSQTYGGAYEDRLYSVDLCNDGGYILTGTSGENSSRRNLYLVRTDAQGDLLWEVRLGEDEDDVGHDVRQLEDGTFAIAGYTMNYGAERYDAMLLRVDADGNVIWRRLYGNYLEDRTISLALTQDGGFLLGGYSQSYGNGNWDIYLVRADSEGDLVWFGVFGELGNETGYTFIEVDDGSVALTGETYSSNLGGGDLIILKIGPP